MNIVVNTNYVSAGTKVYIDDLVPRLMAAGHNVVRNDWDNYQSYDMALFMSPDAQVDVAKKQHPQILAGVMDPKLKLKKEREQAALADFLIVCSIEQRDAFLTINKKIFIYHTFPQMKPLYKEHQKKETIRIGYHGNKLHLHSFSPHVTQALEELSKLYDIELVALYNREKLGTWKFKRPDTLKIQDIQWSKDAYQEEFASCDIGIVNNLLPIRTKLGRFFTSFGKTLPRINPFGFDKDDRLSRYKYSTNPGRIYVFSQLGIPVVADMVPSACQVIQDRVSGFLVHSTEGWYSALEQLIQDHVLRQQMSDALRSFIDEHVSIDKNFESLNSALVTLYTSSQTT